MSDVLFRSFVAFFPFLQVVAPAAAKLLNITVDDRDGPDIPVGGRLAYGGDWIDTGIDLCQPSCQADPEFHKAYHGTWKKSGYTPQEDGLSVKTASLSFNGTAVYVFCILSTVSDNGIQGNSDMTFYIDGTIVSNFTRPKSNHAMANTLVFSMSPGSLPMAVHNLMIQNGRPGTQLQTLLLLDYVIYTTDDSWIPSNLLPGQTSSSTSTSVTPTITPTHADSNQNKSDNGLHRIHISVAICAVIAFLVLGVLLFLIFRRRLNRGQHDFIERRSSVYTSEFGLYNSGPSISTSYPSPLHTGSPSAPSVIGPGSTIVTAGSGDHGDHGPPPTPSRALYQFKVMPHEQVQSKAPPPYSIS